MTGVRFGGVPATSFVVNSAAEITAVSPASEPGPVGVTVTTRFGTSPARESARYTYVAAETVVGFDDLTTGGPGQANVRVATQYAARGVTFNDLSAIDYAKGGPPGFARSGTVAVEPCVGVELCTVPIRGTFSAAKRLVRVWVGLSAPIAQPLQVRLTALTAAGSVVGTADATLPANASVTPIRTPLEVKVDNSAIARFEVAIPGGYNNGLAMDDVTFDAG